MRSYINSQIGSNELFLDPFGSISLDGSGIDQGGHLMSDLAFTLIQLTIMMKTRLLKGDSDNRCPVSIISQRNM